MTDTVEITVRLNASGECRRRTVRLNPEKEAHQKAIEGLQTLRADGHDTHDDIVRAAIRRTVDAPLVSYTDALQRLQSEWTEIGEPLSEAAVIRECLRRAGQGVDA
jgi:hypothetical protein